MECLAAAAVSADHGHASTAMQLAYPMRRQPLTAAALLAADMSYRDRATTCGPAVFKRGLHNADACMRVSMTYMHNIMQAQSQHTNTHTHTLPLAGVPPAVSAGHGGEQQAGAAPTPQVPPHTQVGHVYVEGLCINLASNLQW